MTAKSSKVTILIKNNDLMYLSDHLIDYLSESMGSGLSKSESNVLRNTLVVPESHLIQDVS